ncbi:ATP-binding cassette domain-containing protein [Ewingella americana]
MTNPILTLDRVSLVLPNGTPLFTELTEQFDGRHTGLVGRNGVGKSLLAQLLAGLLAPSSGQCNSSGKVRYLAQHLTPEKYPHVAALAGVASTLAALQRIEAGSVSPSDFEQVGDDWDIRQRLQTQLESAGLGYLSPESPVSQLSGGEAMRVALIGATLSDADFLILDEPTNHLDGPSRRALMQQLQNWTGGLVVISHDPRAAAADGAHCRVVFTRVAQLWRQLRLLPAGESTGDGRRRAEAGEAQSRAKTGGIGFARPA